MKKTNGNAITSTITSITGEVVGSYYTQGIQTRKGVTNMHKAILLVNPNGQKSTKGLKKIWEAMGLSLGQIGYVTVTTFDANEADARKDSWHGRTKGIPGTGTKITLTGDVEIYFGRTKNGDVRATAQMILDKYEAHVIVDGVDQVTGEVVVA